MSALDLMKIPESADLARELPSDVLYQLEAAGQLATEILDERVVQWTEEGWSQRKIGDELGCSHQAVSKRQARLGVESSQPKRVSGNPVATSNGEVEIVDAEPVPDEDEPEVVSGEVVSEPESSSPAVPDPGPRVKCPTCGHMVNPDDVQAWRE